MCQFSNCMTETKALGFCIVCGKEICSDCADKKNPKKHTSCIILSGPLISGGDPFPDPR